MWNRTLRLSFLLLPVVLTACLGPARGPGTAAGATGSLTFAPPDSVLLVRGERQRAAFANIDRIFPTRTIDAGGETFSLGSRSVDLSGLTFEVGGESFDLDRFLDHTQIGGLLVLQGGDVVLERYALGSGPATRWVSYSISKSVVSLLVGAALEDGYLRNLDEPLSAYLPVLEGSAYEGVTFRHALQMASGVQWTDGYTSLDSDFNRSLTTPTLEQLRGLGARERVAEVGTRYNYNSAETHLLATALRAAIGNNLATYLSSEIWRPFGMEADAHWLLVEPDGGEHGGCCFSATLRDYGRLGLFAMRDGVLPNGERVLPEGWMAESTSPSPANPGYGYLWWLREGGAYAAIGIFGQAIWIDPEAELVVVTHSAWPQAAPYFNHIYAFAEAVRERLGSP